MAWEILIACFSLFGMLALAVASARMEDTGASATINEGAGRQFLSGFAGNGRRGGRPCDARMTRWRRSWPACPARS